jgi:hypothetical protein
MSTRLDVTSPDFWVVQNPESASIAYTEGVWLGTHEVESQVVLRTSAYGEVSYGVWDYIYPTNRSFWEEYAEVNVLEILIEGENWTGHPPPQDEDWKLLRRIDLDTVLDSDYLGETDVAYEVTTEHSKATFNSPFPLNRLGGLELMLNGSYYTDAACFYNKIYITLDAVIDQPFWQSYRHTVEVLPE